MMTDFYQEDYRIRSVRIGEQSSLPGLEGLANVQQNTKAVLDEDDEIFLGYGFRSNVFPYRPQDVYTREQTERCYRSIVLENEFLRARFLPELGGRLISLTDKASGRDLLYQNKTLYAGNLAMRNSWFSGGVEWNASIIGHNPFTCSPLFAARTQLADGTPVLRMYEYERLRGVSFQMDFSCRTARGCCSRGCGWSMKTRRPSRPTGGAISPCRNGAAGAWSFRRTRRMSRGTA